MQGTGNDVIFTMDIKDVLAGNDIENNSQSPRMLCENNDFEDWVASSENGSAECILGMRYTYHRVKRTDRAAACFLPKDYKLSSTSSEVRTLVRLSFRLLVLCLAPER